MSKTKAIPAKPAPLRGYSCSLAMWYADGSRGCGLTSGKPTLGETVAEAIRNAAYYLSAEVGYAAVDITISEFCGECRGSGYARRTSRRSCKCRACKGVGIFPDLFTSRVTSADLFPKTP